MARAYAADASISANYAALRYAGFSAARAAFELGIRGALAERTEGLFLASNPGGKAERMRPRFARHQAHLDAIRSRGAYPALFVA